MKISPKKDTHIQIRISLEDYKCIKSYADSIGLSVSYFIRLLLKPTIDVVKSSQYRSAHNENE